MECANILLKVPNEEFISENGFVIIRDELDYINNGRNSVIWKYMRDDYTYAFKTFVEERHKFALQYDVYKVMKQLPLQNIVKPLEIYKRKSNTREKTLDAYLMKYIDSSFDISILDFPIDLIIKSICGLEEDANQLSQNCIFMHDVGTKNTIVDNEKKINIIDIDMYFINNSYKEGCENQILKSNRWQIANMIKNLLVNCLKDDQRFNEEQIKTLRSNLAKSLAIDIFENESLPSRMSTIFKNCETPRQYFLERR